MQKDQAEAFRVLGLAMNYNPKDPNLIAIFAQLLDKMECQGMSVLLWDVFLRTNPEQQQYIQALRSKGLAAAKTGALVEEGAALMREALALDPDPYTMGNLALYELSFGSREKALELSNRAIELKPNAHAYECRAYARLMVQDWGGWEDWEHSVGSSYRPDEGPEPYWRGESGSLLIRGEQGLGDEISFASILPDVKEATLECDKRLEGLFKRSFPHLEVMGTRLNRQAKKHDYRCLIGSLATHYRKRDEDFPGTPYLVADPQRRVQWRALLDTLPGKKVGIAWTGGASHTMALQRSFTLAELDPILANDCTFISLQYQDSEEDPRIKVFPWGTRTQDYDDTAALVAELDLVISATTAVAHLAGALGKECWILAPEHARWFYGVGRNIPWYKSAEIFRQADKIEEVAARLHGYLHEPSHSDPGLHRTS